MSGGLVVTSTHTETILSSQNWLEVFILERQQTFHMLSNIILYAVLNIAYNIAKAVYSQTYICL